MAKALFLFTISAMISLHVSAQDFKAYNNFDFVPGEKIIFEDLFQSDKDGEFPTHWKLESGQGVINTKDGEKVFAVTKYYSKYSPLMKLENYIPAQYTIEFDTWHDAGYDSNPGIYIELRNGKDIVGNISTNNSYFVCEFGENKLQGDLPVASAGDAYFNKWHHIAVAVQDNQMKIYCDQNRIVVVPNSGIKATHLAVGGNASEGFAMLFKNFRVAEGGGMNILDKKFTDAKIITHGIHFDFNQSTIKPESMGTLNNIVTILKNNPEVKFEIGGHTDSDGDEAYNLTLSQQRSEAVKAQLIKMGVEGSRLTAVGYGKNKPINNNNTPEGKADNRRVEFTKM